MKRITLIGDDTVAYRIQNEGREMGATGYTAWGVRRPGDRGIRPRHAEPDRSKIEVMATPEVAERTLEHIAGKYFNDYAMIAFLDDMEVVRGGKFGAKVT